MNTTYLLCAAGLGTRFKDLFPITPKPLLRVKGRTLLEWSLASLRPFHNDTVIIITRRKEKIRSSLEKMIAARFHCHIKWLELDQPTRGQLETALFAEHLVDKSHQLIVYNSDTYFESQTLPQKLLDPTIDGIIPCFTQERGPWSYCACDENGRVLKVAEKNPISKYASVGYYQFRSAKLFFEIARESISHPGDSELFVAPIYNIFIEKNKNIVIDQVSYSLPLGTIDQIKKSLNISKEELLKDNPQGTIVVDLDGTLTIDDTSLPYEQRKPNIAVIEKLKKFKEKGYNIIIHTARRMKTFHGDESLVLANIGLTTIQWLNKYEVPYDGIRMGKPYAENGFYLDDKAYHTDDFISEEIQTILTKINSS